MDKCEDCKNFYNCTFAKQNEEKGIIAEECTNYRSFAEYPPKTLKEVHEVFLKWFPNLDTTRIDTRLAWYLSNEYGLGTPVWIFELTRSGLTKTTLTNAFSNIPKIIQVDQLTAKALASGLEVGRGKNKKPAVDIGMRLQNRNRCIIVSETAYIKAMQHGDQRETFAVLKSLHDGRIKRDTGSGVSKDYQNCNTSIWFNSTKDFHEMTIIHQEIGTCYIVDSIPLDMTKDKEDSKQALLNMDKLGVITKETQEVVSGFLAHHHLNKEYQLSSEERDFITRETERLKFLRTTGTYDFMNELTYFPEPEKPARVSQQFEKLYISLLSLDEKYDTKRAKKIIMRMIDGSGDPILIKILEYINDTCWNKLKTTNESIPFTITDIWETIGLGTGTIKRRLELLCGLKFLIKEPKGSGPSGGNPHGFQYRLKKNVDEKDWQLLFRDSIIKDEDINQQDEVNF